MQWKHVVWTIQRAFCEQWSGSFCELLRILIYTLLQISVAFAFYLTAYNFRIPGCNCNHTAKVTAPLQHNARVSRPDIVLYLGAICKPISKLKQTNIMHNSQRSVLCFPVCKEPCCFYFASSKLLLPSGDIEKSPVVTSLLLLKVTTYLGRKKLNMRTTNRSLRHARRRGTAMKVTVMERVSFNYGPWVIHPIDKAVSAERNTKTNYISYTF